MKATQVIKLINKISLAVITVTLFVFPLFFLTNTTEAFLLPKQILLVLASSILLVLWAARGIAERKLVIKNSPLNIPIALFGIIVLISSLLSRNMYDSLAISIPLFAAIVFYFIIINTISDKKSFMIAFFGLISGAVFSSLVSILYNFNIFFLPIAAIENRYFSTFGSPVQHLIYLVPVAIVGILSFIPELRSKRKITGGKNIVLLSASVILIAAAGVLIYQLITAPQKPAFLPYTSGFQIGAASISQDTGLRSFFGIGVPSILISLPLGSGYGTFLSDFTRYKTPEINLNPTLWTATFTSSSSYVLELVATTGVLGLLSYLFITAKLLKTRSKEADPIFYTILAMIAASFFIPFTLIAMFLLFTLIGFYVSYLFLLSDRRVFDISISLVALRHGLISFQDVPENARPRKSDSVVFPIIFSILIVFITGFVSYQAIRLLSADTKIAASLSQVNRNNGQAVYDLQLAALSEYPFRSDYYRIFSQINLALANSIVSGVPQGQTPTDQTRQTISSLLQQAVNNARAAVALSPTISLNWENLSQIYRSLIGVGQGAEEFTILTLNQAIALDPSNPLLRIELGGVYLQLQQYDAAQQQFIAAIKLKPDLANAYYNLANAQEANQQFEQALASYQATLSLITNPDDKKALEEKISTLKEQVGNAQPTTQVPEGTQASENQPPLGVNSPAAPLPTNAPQIKVSPPPAEAVEASPTPTTTPAPEEEN